MMASQNLALGSVRAKGTVVDLPLQHRIDLLERLRPFQGLSIDLLNTIAGVMEPVRYNTNDIILSENETDYFIYIVQQGVVSVHKQVAKSSITPGLNHGAHLYYLKAGNGSGFGSFFENMPHSATVVATEPVTLFRISHDQFRKLLTENPQIPLAFLTYLSEELRDLRGHYANIYATLSDEASLVPSTDTKVSKICVAFFDSKEYMASFFRRQLSNYPGIEIRFLEVRLSKDTVKLANGCQAVCCFVNDHVSAETAVALQRMNINLIALRCAGFNNIDIKACDALQLSVCRVPAYSPFAVAEHAVALLLSLNRHINKAHERVRNGNFTLDGLMGWDVHGTTIGVLGTGKIGQVFIDIMLGFGCNILCCDKYPCEALKNKPRVKYVEQDELFANSRAISIHLPLTPETYHIINKKTLTKMKRGVVIINTSRGALIETQDLIDALKSGLVGGAGLDVYEEEDYYFFEDWSGVIIQDDKLARLMSFSNCIITSHQAFLTEDALEKIAHDTLDNIQEYLDGKRLIGLTNAVTPQNLL